MIQILFVIFELIIIAATAGICHYEVTRIWGKRVGGKTHEK
jgi:hypothetical protein